MHGRVSVASADFIRKIGHWQNEALRRPISIMHHGRERLVLATPEEFDAVAADDAATKASLETLRADADAMIENLEDGFLAFDTSLRVKRSNTIAEAFIGRSHAMLHGAAAAEFMPPPVGPVLDQRLQRVMRTRKHERFEATIGDRHVSVRVFPLTDGAAVLFANTTEQHHQRMRLGVGSALCAATERHPQTAAVTLDVGGRVTDIQGCFCDWLGRERDDLLGRPLLDLAEERGDVSTALEAALAGAAAQHITVTLLGDHAHRVRGTLALAAIRADGMSHGAVGVMVLEEDVNPGRRLARPADAESNSMALSAPN